MANSLIFDILARDRASAAFNKVSKNVDKSAKGLQRFKTFATGAGLVAGAALAKFGGDSVAAFTEAEQAQTRLEDAYRRFPKLAEVNIKWFRNLNTELAKKTQFDDDAYASGQAVLAQFKLTGDQILELTPLLGDYAAKTGKTVPDAAKLLGKAFLGNTRALKDLGINYKMTGHRATDVANITDAVQRKVAGFAETAGKTAAGKTAILRNQFGELQETIGSKLLPVLLKLTDAGLKVVGFIQRNASVILPLAGALAVVVGAIKAWTVAQAALNVVMALNPIGLVVIAIAALAAGLVIAWKKSETFRDTVKAVFRAVALGALMMAKFFLQAGKMIFDALWNWVLMPLNALLTVMSKLPGGMGKPFAAAKKALDGFKNSADDAFNSAIDKVDDWERTLRNAPKIAKLKGDIKDLDSKLATARKKLRDPELTRERRAKLNAEIADLLHKKRVAQTAINSLHGKSVTVTLNMALQAAGGDWGRLRGLQGLQHGGIVTRPIIAKVGEAGPEAVIPLSRGRHGLGGSTIVNVNVMVAPNADKAAVGRATVDAIEDYLKKGGKLPPRMRGAA